MMNFWDRLVWEIGYAICHQMPERTIFFGERGLPVCARDTGLYAGFFLVFAAVIIPWGKEQGELPSNIAKVLIMLALLFLVGDILTAGLGWRESNNFLRLLSGVLAGGGLALVVGPYFNRLALGTLRGRRALSETPQLIVLALVIFSLLGLFLWHPRQLFGLAQVLIVLSILGTLLILNLTLLLALFSGGYGSSAGRRSCRAMAVFILASLILVTLELFLTHRLHSWLESSPLSLGSPFLP